MKIEGAPRHKPDSTWGISKSRVNVIDLSIFMHL